MGAVGKMEIDGKTTPYALIRVVHAHALGSELAHLFELKQRSLAKMERLARTPQRRRASGAWTA